MTETPPDLDLTGLFKYLFSLYINCDLSRDETEEYTFTIVENRIKFRPCLLFSKEIEYLAALAFAQYYSRPFAQINITETAFRFLLEIHPYYGKVTLKVQEKPDWRYMGLITLFPHQFLDGKLLDK